MRSTPFHIGMLAPALAGLTATVALGGIAPSRAAQPPKNFAVHEKPRSLPEVRFVNAEGRMLRLAEFRGKVVLLNIWATWCGPCRREMPTLDRLQAKLGGPVFEVIALSIDRAGIDAVKPFYEELKLQRLAIYVDRSAKVTRQLAVIGIPTTLLIDAEGREIGRLAGPAEWDAPAFVTFIESRLPKGAAPDPGKKR